MRLQVQNAIEKELNRAIKKRFVPKEFESNIKKMSEQMFNRFLHDATQNLRQSSAQTNGSNKVDAIREIFNIDIDDSNIQQYDNEHHVKGYR